MPITVQHVKNVTIADSADTSLVRPSDWNSAHNITYSPTGAELIGAFSNGGNVTFSTNPSGFIVGTAPAGGAGGVAISAGTASQSTGTVAFSNGNNVSFGLNAGTITASASYPAQTVQTQNLVSIQGSTGNISFQNGNGITFGGNASTLTASHNGITQQSTQPVAYSAANGSANFSTLSFANSNGVSFSTGTQGVYATVKTDYLTTARASTDAVGLNTAATNVTWTVNSSGISINGSGYAGTGTTTGATNANVTANLNSNGLAISVSVNGGGAVDGYNSAQFTNSTANSTMPIVWAGNSNGSGNVTMGLTGSTVTMSAPSGGGAADGVNVLGVNGQATSLTTTYYLSNGNNVSFGYNAGTITASASYAAQTQQPMYWAASGTTTNSNTLVFGNTQGVSFSLSNGSLVGSVKTDYQSSNANYLTSQSNQAFSAGAASSVFQTLSFQDSNGVSFSNNAGAIRLTHDLQYTSATSAITANAFPSANTTKFAGSGVTTASTAGTDFAITQNSLGLSMGVPKYLTTTAAQTNQTANFYVSGNTTQLSSTAGLDLRSVSFEGAGIASVGVSNGRVLVSVPSGGGAGDGYNIVQIGTTGTTGTAWSTLSGTVQINGTDGIYVSQNNSNQIVVGMNPINMSLLGNIAPGANSTVADGTNGSWYISGGAGVTLSGTGSTMGINVNTTPDAWYIQGNTLGANSSYAWTNDALYLAGGNNITLSQNGSTLTIIGAAGGGGGVTAKSLMVPQPHLLTTVGSLGTASASVQFIEHPGPLSWTGIYIPMSVSVTTAANSSFAGQNFSVTYVIATQNGSTLNSSVSTTWTAFQTWQSNTTGSVTGGKVLSTAWNASLPAGDYYHILHIQTAATGGGLTGVGGGTATTSLGNTVSIMGAGSAIFGAVTWGGLGAVTASSNGPFGEAGHGLCSSTGQLTNLSLSNVSKAGTFGQRALFGVAFRG